MSTLPSDEHYAWDQSWQLWKIEKYDYGTRQYGFKQWMPRGWAAAPAQQPTQQHQPPAPQHQLHTLPAQSPFQNSQQYGARHEQDAEVAAVQQNAQGYGPTGQWSGSQMQPEEQHIGPLDTESKSDSSHNRVDSANIEGIHGVPHSFDTVIARSLMPSATVGSANLRPATIRQSTGAVSEQPYYSPGQAPTNQSGYGMTTWTQQLHSTPAHQQYQTTQQYTGGSYSNGQYGGRALTGGHTMPMHMGQNSGTYPNAPQQSSQPRGEGEIILATYPGGSTLKYELVDPTFHVKDKTFFHEGKVFAVIMNETAGETARPAKNPVDYASASINPVKYLDNFVYTNVRRFVVVRAKREFCFACPVFTYSGRGTTKPGVRASEHGIICSWGQKAELLPGESGITKTALNVVMAAGERNLHKASRIYYGIHHPIQYNVKVKEIGYIPEIQIPILQGNWKEEDASNTGQESDVTAYAEVPQEVLEPARRSDGQAYAGAESAVLSSDHTEKDEDSISQLTQTFSNTYVQDVTAHDATSSASSRRDSTNHRSSRSGRTRR